MLSKEDLTDFQLDEFGKSYNSAKKSKRKTWLLFIFLGFYGGHSFYLDDNVRGSVYLGLCLLVQIIALSFMPMSLCIMFILLAMLIYDAFRINSLVDEHNYKLELDTINEILSSK